MINVQYSYFQLARASFSEKPSPNAYAAPPLRKREREDRIQNRGAQKRRKMHSFCGNECPISWAECLNILYIHGLECSWAEVKSRSVFLLIEAITGQPPPFDRANPWPRSSSCSASTATKTPATLAPAPAAQSGCADAAHADRMPPRPNRATARWCAGLASSAGPPDAPTPLRSTPPKPLAGAPTHTSV